MLNQKDYFVVVERFLRFIWREKGWDYREACILDEKNSRLIQERFNVIQALRKRGER